MLALCKNPASSSHTQSHLDGLELPSDLLESTATHGSSVGLSKNQQAQHIFFSLAVMIPHLSAYQKYPWYHHAVATP